VVSQWVFGGVERETGKCFLIPVEWRDKETLLVAIKDWILPETLISDCWKVCNPVFNLQTINYTYIIKILIMV
jgi:hypothetical protein